MKKTLFIKEVGNVEEIMSYDTNNFIKIIPKEFKINIDSPIQENISDGKLYIIIELVPNEPNPDWENIVLR